MQCAAADRCAERVGCVRLFPELQEASSDSLPAFVTAVFGFGRAWPHECERKNVVLRGFPEGLGGGGILPLCKAFNWTVRNALV